MASLWTIGDDFFREAEPPPAPPVPKALDRLPSKPAWPAQFFLRAGSPTTAVAIYRKKASILGPIIYAVDDGVRWSATLCPFGLGAPDATGERAPHPILAPFFLPWRPYSGPTKPTPGTVFQESTSKVSGPTLALIAWATHLNLSATNPTAERGAPNVEHIGSKVLPSATVGTIRYDGWAPLAKRSAHTLDALHRSVDDAVRKARAAWGWAAEGLVVSFHKKQWALGLAYNPGAKDRRISISEVLLEKYNLDSIHRTVLHELCHHAREEMHPRTRRRGRSRLAQLDTHDAKFCEMLAQVDPLVAGSQQQCQFFNGMEDVSAALASAAAKGVTYTAASGSLEIVLRRKGRLLYGHYIWHPNKGRAEAAVSIKTFAAFLARFPALDRPQLRTRWASVRRSEPTGVRASDLMRGAVPRVTVEDRVGTLAEYVADNAARAYAPNTHAVVTAALKAP
jgi:predicted SprT family Zn-dependent metalloprotease